MTATTDGALYRLMAWLSPSYPVGAYSYSHGLEYAVEAGLVRDAAQAADWIATIVLQGGGFADAVILAEVHKAFVEDDTDRLAEVAEFAQALGATAELRLETQAQGAAFLEVTEKAWPTTALECLRACWSGPYVYPVVVAVTAAGHGVGRQAAVGAYLHAFAANLVSAALRLVPLGQTAGQTIIAGLEPVVARSAGQALATPLEELGTATLMVDICSMKHETQYSRLFRS